VEKDKEILTLRRELDAATAAAPSGTAVGTVRILSEMVFFPPCRKLITLLLCGDWIAVRVLGDRNSAAAW
jgi:hypothetical protein